MTDHLHNTWGCFLIPEHQTQAQAPLYCETQALMDKLVKIVNDNFQPSNSSTLIHQDLKQFNGVSSKH
eukprot:2253093-Ditylum_brightwellii.AAC.1